MKCASLATNALYCRACYRTVMYQYIVPKKCPRGRSSSLSRDFNLSLQSECSSYLLNDSLTQRGDLQVQLSDKDLETPFDSFTNNGSGVTSTPEPDR